MELRVAKHAKARLRERFRSHFSSDQLARPYWLINHLIKNSTESIGWKNNHFNVNKHGMNIHRDVVYCFQQKMFFVVKDNCVVTVVPKM